MFIERQLKTGSGENLTNGQRQGDGPCRLLCSFGDFLCRRLVAFPAKISLIFFVEKDGTSMVGGINTS
jgi:hypothetical protein